ncbi:hypothetical protein ACVV62_00215 [Streptococcus pluranimalium]
MTYNKAVEDYNLAITVMPYHAIKKSQPLDYFSDFLIYAPQGVFLCLKTTSLLQ